MIIWNGTEIAGDVVESHSTVESARSRFLQIAGELGGDVLTEGAGLAGYFIEYERGFLECGLESGSFSPRDRSSGE